MRSFEHYQPKNRRFRAVYSGVSTSQWTSPWVGALSDGVKRTWSGGEHDFVNVDVRGRRAHGDIGEEKHDKDRARSFAADKEGALTLDPARGCHLRRVR